MISDSCDFEEFVAVANKWTYADIITQAEREATEAERRLYCKNYPKSDQTRCGQEYADCLKRFITFMRYGIKPARIDREILQHFDRVREAEFQIKRRPPARMTV